MAPLFSFRRTTTSENHRVTDPLESPQKHVASASTYSLSSTSSDQNPFSNRQEIQDRPHTDSFGQSTLRARVPSIVASSSENDFTESKRPEAAYYVSPSSSSSTDSFASEGAPLTTSGGAGYITTVHNGKLIKIKQKLGRSSDAAKSTSFPSALPERPVRAPKQSIWRRCVNAINRQFDIKNFLRLFDIRPWFWPFTWKKYFTLILIAIIIAGIVVSDHYTHWLKKSIETTRRFMLPVLIISVCTEPLIILTILPTAIMPDIPQHELKANLDLRLEDPEGTATGKNPHGLQGPFETAVVTPCHNTDLRTIKTTMLSALEHFRPQDIFIIDNSKSKYPTHPTTNFRAYIRDIHPDINYIWSPIGSKNAAQMVGAMAARNKGYKYIITADDDVSMPKNFSPPTDLIDDVFKAVAYPLKAMDANCKSSLWLVAWQDVEYRLSGLAKLAEDRLCGVQFPHGAGWFVEINAFIELMEKHHPMDFIAEDCNCGLGFSKMNLGIRFDARSFLATEVPTTFFGPGLNWWAQRQKSWEMGRHGLLFSFIRELLFSMPPKRTIQGIFWHKITFMYNICTIIIDWVRVPVFVALGTTWEWWRNAICLMMFSSVPPLLYNIWKCRRRPDMRVNTWAAITYPWYKQLYNLVCLCGAIRCAMYYFGGHQKAPRIQKMLADEDWRCFWLDPRFKENPGFLADEGEMLAAEKLSSLSSSSESLPEKLPAADGVVVAVDEISISPPSSVYGNGGR